MHIRFDGESGAVVVSDDGRPTSLDRAQLRRLIDEAATDPRRCVNDRFLIVETVERGSAGALHRAWDGDEERFVALRTVEGVGQLTPDARRELERATLLRHDSILAPLVGGTGVTRDGRLFIATAIAPGRSLEPRRDEPAVADPQEAARLVRDLARALAYAQGLGLVHGALHPASVLIDPDGNARLIDFGLAAAEAASPARALRLVARLERAGVRAPEVTPGVAPDPLADIYALGALLLRRAAAKAPGELVADEDGPDPDLPADLDAVIRRCLEVDRTRRYGSPGELARELDRWLAGERPEAASLPLGRRVNRCWRQVREAALRVAARLSETATRRSRETGDEPNRPRLPLG
jgi:serine/threonine-protein kinase